MTIAGAAGTAHQVVGGEPGLQTQDRTHQRPQQAAHQLGRQGDEGQSADEQQHGTGEDADAARQLLAPHHAGDAGQDQKQDARNMQETMTEAARLRHAADSVGRFLGGGLQGGNQRRQHGRADSGQ